MKVNMTRLTIGALKEIIKNSLNKELVVISTQELNRRLGLFNK